MGTLEKYLAGRRKKLEKLQKQICLLEKARMPLKVCDRGDELDLFSDDYHLAEYFKILKRSEHLGGFSGPDGGVHTDRYETYPQFMFELKNGTDSIPVYIRHEGFDKDKRIAIRSIIRTDGCKDYSSDNRIQENYINLEDVFGFFRKRGVPECLLSKLNDRIEEASDF